MKTLAERDHLKFSEMFASAMSRTEVVVTFLALRELIRRKQLVAVHAEAFGEIEIRRAAMPVVPPAQPSAVETGAAGL